jgi:hypothetical protein
MCVLPAPAIRPSPFRGGFKNFVAKARTDLLHRLALALVNNSLKRWIAARSKFYRA